MSTRRTQSRVSAWGLGLALLGFAVAFAAPARAQNNSCCTFQVTVANTINTNCLPLTITTNWGPPTVTTQNDTKSTTGRSTYTVPNCPPNQNFNWVSLDGGTTTLTLAGSPGYLPVNATCGRLCVNAIVNGDGCIEIRISNDGTSPCEP